MKVKKIELNLLIFILLEALFLLFFFKTNLINFILGSILGFIIYTILKRFSSNKIGKIILIIISLFLFFLILYHIIDFISYNILKNYSIWIISFSLIVTIYYLSIKGFHPFIKTLEISMYFVLFVKVLSIILLLPQININNFNQNLLTNISINNSFIIISLFTSFILLLTYTISNKEISIKEFSFSIIHPILLKLLIISILGKTLTDIYYYPYISVFKRIKYFDFIERMEGILSFQYLCSFFFLVTFVSLSILTLFKSIRKK